MATEVKQADRSSLMPAGAADSSAGAAMTRGDRAHSEDQPRGAGTNGASWSRHDEMDHAAALEVQEHGESHARSGRGRIEAAAASFLAWSSRRTHCWARNAVAGLQRTTCDTFCRSLRSSPSPTGASTCLSKRFSLRFC